MLKAKRIAKIILCISIAFSMLTSINAEIFEVTIGETIANISYTEPHKNIIDYLKNNKFIWKASYIASESSQLIYIKSNEPIYIGIKATLWSHEVNINNLIGMTNFISQLSGLYPINILYCIPNNNEIKFEAFYGENIYYKTNTVYILEKQQNLIERINDVSNLIIDNISNIFTFLTDKPWIILLGVTVSLLSLLIYKAKRII